MSCCRIVFLCILIRSFSFTFSRNQNILSKGSSLSAEHRDTDVLMSPDKTFACGFYSFGENANWFAIWFNNSVNKTVVWVANRDKPVNSQGSRIFLSKKGAMVLMDVDRSVVWTTNTNTNTNPSIIAKAELLDSGNLVLRDTNGTIKWQSFDYPTDTLLPTQQLVKTTKLVSAMGIERFDSGYYNLFFDNDNVMRLLYDGPNISSLYWPSPDFSVFQNGRTTYNSSRIAVLDGNGLFSSSDQMSFISSDTGYGIKRRLTLDYDGNLRLYSLDRQSGRWNITWEALTQPCSIHGICGRNGVCIYAPEPKCSCPPGFMRSNKSDWSMGCKAKFKRPPSPNETVEFVKIPHTDFYGFDLSYDPSVSLKYCKHRCIADIRCEAFTYRPDTGGACFTKSVLFNGYQTPSFPGSIYLKVPSHARISDSISKGTDLTCENKSIKYPVIYGNMDGTVQWIYLYSFSAALGFIEVLTIVSGWLFLSKMHRTVASVEKGYLSLASQFRRFSYTELKKSTKNFIEELGQGASGVVYKGILDDDRLVAVKKLTDVYQGEEVFWAEVSTIGNIYHMNLVRMWGFCSEGKHRMLVYEYVENQSLDKHLFSANFIGWKERFKVALGTAKALAYLHHECLEWVIHCDIKPENILLDRDFEPKISDFGLAKLLKRGNPISDLTQIRGTKGYIAPEWTLNLPITTKVDVYSYGVVILEMVKGVRLSNSISLVRDNNGENLSEFTQFVKTAKRNIQCGQDSWTDEIVDERLEGKFNQNQVFEMVRIGLCCVEEDKSKRPTMDHVVQVLLICEE